MIIGISGKKQSGKDTVCNIIKALDIYYNEELEISNKGTVVEFVKSCMSGRFGTLEAYRNILSRWEKHSFADSLKLSLGIILNVPRHKFEDEEFKRSYSKVLKLDGKTFYTYRELLQIMGTEVCRTISSDIWIRSLMDRYEQEYQDMCSLYLNSISLYDLPCWIVPDVRFPDEANAIVEKNGFIIRINRPTAEGDVHISETAMDDYNNYRFTIENDKDIDSLILAVQAIMKQSKLI